MWTLEGAVESGRRSLRESSPLVDWPQYLSSYFFAVLLENSEQR